MQESGQQFLPATANRDDRIYLQQVDFTGAINIFPGDANDV
jgi:hypothetical protein